VLEAIRAVAARTLQLPPPYSAKKIDGQRAYALARQQQAVTLAPVPVQVRTFDVQEITDDDVIVDVTCSAGFYVRSFAHDLGTTLGVGACLERLRRIESGPFTLSQAVTLAQLDAGLPDDAIVSIDNLLPDFPAVVVDEAGRNRFGHGQPLRPGDIREVVPGRSHARPDEGWVRVFHGPALVGLAQRGADAALHPAIVLI
jgi:tRNA pseudouridine55 synthase